MELAGEEINFLTIPYKSLQTRLSRPSKKKNASPQFLLLGEIARDMFQKVQWQSHWRRTWIF